jgi:glycosyltransferase involved in cell wall biosynthesis
VSGPLTATVVVPTRNRPALLQAALLSLSEQDVPADRWEVVVCDDGSDPPAAETVHGTGVDAPARVVRQESRVGRAGNRNAGIRAALGEVIILLDDDMTVGPDFVRSHLERHTAGDRAAYLGRIETSPRIPRSTYVEYLDTRGAAKVGEGAEVPYRYFVTGNSSVRRAHLVEAGLFDEALSGYGGEDTALGYALGEIGVTLRYAPEAWSHHHRIYPLEDLLGRLETYGETMLPIMVARYPEMRRDLKLAWCEPPRPALDPFEDLFVKLIAPILFARPLSFGLRALSRLERLGGLLYPVYDHLRMDAVRRGYRRHLAGASGNGAGG